MAITLRYKDLVIRYTSDFNFDVILRQRVYKTQTGDIQTPIPPKLLERLVTDGCKPPRQKPFDDRHTIACFANPDNQTGESNLRTMVPFIPGSEDHKQLLNEIKNYENVATIEYFGEEHKLNIRRFYRVNQSI